MMTDGKRGRGSVAETSSKERIENTASFPGPEIGRTLKVLFEPGAVIELRAFKEWTESGYFDDVEALKRAATKLDGRGFQVYVTLNDINPALLARAANRVRRLGKSDPTTSDRDIRRRRWLPLDFDPVRPSGVSATDEEKRAARSRALEVVDYLRQRGWPDPAMGDSGNGAHLLYRVDLPNDRESSEFVKGVYEALAFNFDDEVVKLDTSVHNAARIWRLYGTTARKGDDLAQRPHRASQLLRVSEVI